MIPWGKSPTGWDILIKHALHYRFYNKLIEEVDGHYLNSHRYEPLIIIAQHRLGKNKNIKKEGDSYYYEVPLFGIKIPLERSVRKGQEKRPDWLINYPAYIVSKEFALRLPAGAKEKHREFILGNRQPLEQHIRKVNFQ